MRFAAVVVSAVMALSLAPMAVADPNWPVAGSGSASETISALESQGYEVQINWVNGNTLTPLVYCTVNGINNPDRSGREVKANTTVYVDVSCPNYWDVGD
ncbi:hypothetical protein [Mycobacteroides saopaulense]|uniref:PASTA domain-containing protein n=1 Tax=Mycobacteroides saopaulense TaxID=1578165 RepID=A0ABX3BXN6_9MYCO|nr:hypothetical protein [Mycobacteroides saopaulense]OHT86680.1 hypothetical protein BKG68_11200 [Mycobacteroides saopaulense]OHU08537.1 hypothetical protein BKG73_15890 [Mycobacteroides saopaulense]